MCILQHDASVAASEPGVGATWTDYWNLLTERGYSGYSGISGYSGSVASAGTGGTGSAGEGKQYVAVNIGGTVYKLLHDGTIE